jgi:hypothetical protein
MSWQVERAYRDYNAAISNAWRTPPGTKQAVQAKTKPRQAFDRAPRLSRHRRLDGELRRSGDDERALVTAQRRRADFAI